MTMPRTGPLRPRPGPAHDWDATLTFTHTSGFGGSNMQYPTSFLGCSPNGKKKTPDWPPSSISTAHESSSSPPNWLASTAPETHNDRTAKPSVRSAEKRAAWRLHIILQSPGITLPFLPIYGTRDTSRE
ncbi:hypothetical protein CGMCC3_g2229 [Colletotrichum fructicola]|nr:uncharacterized protein CGMCC3_g2229 [Colletotrichum fructicola]KAE9581773.1 hypothetical protein CGMCC3_g2229 [Colletotrichum fructicola]